MDKALYIAMTGGKHIERAQAVHANNMANAGTTGFRADFEQARAMGVYYGEGLPSRSYSLAENPGTDLSYGSLAETGRDLDIAVDGPGWIAVRGADGKEAYTRAGSLQINALGELQTPDGRAVLGESGPLTIPPQEKISIGTDGTVSVRELGQAPNALGQLGRVKLVNPKDGQLQKGEDGLMYLRAGEKPLKIDDAVRVKNGFVENSNVNIVDEFTSVIALSRQFDMNLKLMRTTEETNTAATKLLQS